MSSRGAEDDQLQPPPWIDDNAVDDCEACRVEFDMFNRRHHCRVCGHIFCAACSSNRLLLPENFDTLAPERVCDLCVALVRPLQARLQASRTKSALPNELRQGDYTGMQRRYLNQPIKFNLAAEIRKACWSIRNQIDGVQTELQDSSVTASMLQSAVGLCFITTLQGGVIVTGTVGTGLVVRKRPDGSWSAPCAVGTIGIGVGASIGLQSTDCIVAISEESSLETFLSSGQFCVGAEVGLSVGLYGRAAKADIRSNERATATTSSYSQSKGLYGGVGLDSSILSIRHDVNRDFYGRDLTAQAILEEIEPPRAATPLYQALAHLYSSFGLALRLTSPSGSVRGNQAWRPAQGDDFAGGGEFNVPRYHRPRTESSTFMRMNNTSSSPSSHELSSETRANVAPQVPMPSSDPLGAMPTSSFHEGGNESEFSLPPGSTPIYNEDEVCI